MHVHDLRARGLERRARRLRSGRGTRGRSPRWPNGARARRRCGARRVADQRGRVVGHRAVDRCCVVVRRARDRLQDQRAVARGAGHGSDRVEAVPERHARRTSERRPYVVLSPEMPHNADGMRTLPPVSVPRPPRIRPAATPVPVPELDPPGHRSRSHGLRWIGNGPSASARPWRTPSWRSSR